MISLGHAAQPPKKNMIQLELKKEDLERETIYFKKNDIALGIEDRTSGLI